MPCPDCKRIAEEVREICRHIAESCEVPEETILAYDNRWDIAIRAAIAREINQLDLTAPSSTEEGKKR